MYQQFFKNCSSTVQILWIVSCILYDNHYTVTHKIINMLFKTIRGLSIGHIFVIATKGSVNNTALKSSIIQYLCKYG